MSSVYDFIDCKQCQSEAYYEYTSGTGEELVQCFACGFATGIEAVNHPEAQSSDSVDQEANESTKNGKIVMRSYKLEGYGGYCIDYKNGGGMVGGFTSPLTFSDVIWFLKALSSPEVDPDGCYLTLWDDKKSQIDVVYGECKYLREEPSEKIRSNEMEGDFLTDDEEKPETIDPLPPLNLEQK